MNWRILLCGIGIYCTRLEDIAEGGEEEGDNGRRRGRVEECDFVLVVFWGILGEKKKKMTSIPYLPTTPLG